MTWRYQIIKHKDWFGLHEVYLNKDGEIDNWTEKPVDFVGDTPEEILTALDMARADAGNFPVFVEPEE